MTLDQVLDLPTGVLVVLGILLILELVLLVVGILAWSGTPDERMPPPNKWLWLAIIALLQIIGPIAFLVLRRMYARYTPGAAQPGAAPAAPEEVRRTATDTADLLYGRPEDEGR
ncbi:MAG: PLD nuclease N-terminal domain-containing protein [Actinomycetota bacterium]